VARLLFILSIALGLHAQFHLNGVSTTPTQARLRADIETILASSSNWCSLWIKRKVYPESDRASCTRRIFAEEVEYTLGCFRQTGAGDPIGPPDFLIEKPLQEIRRRSCAEVDSRK
jgi:hypothetical protein